MELKLFDSERKVMEVLWDHGDLSAKELADRLKELVGGSADLLVANLLGSRRLSPEELARLKRRIEELE